MEAEGSEFTSPDAVIAKAEQALDDAKAGLSEAWVKNFHKCDEGTKLGRYRVWRSALWEVAGCSTLWGVPLDFDIVHAAYDWELPVNRGDNTQVYIKYFEGKVTSDE